MAVEDIDLVRRGYEAFSGGDIETVLEFFDQDIEWRMAADEPDARTYRGRQELLKFWAETLDTFDWFRFELEEVLPAGDRVVAVTRMRGRGKGSGVDVNLPESHLITLRDGKAVRVEEYRSKEEALRAAEGSSGTMRG